MRGNTLWEERRVWKLDTIRGINSPDGAEPGMTSVAHTLTAAIAHLCQKSRVGKRLPEALYVHHSAVGALDVQLQTCVANAQAVTEQTKGATLVKFSLRKPQITFLFYPDFDCDPHPALAHSLQVDLVTHTATHRDYSTTDNPPILHRKDAFVLPDYPLYGVFGWLTHQEEALGLLDDARSIGWRRVWEQRLGDRHLEIHHHSLACSLATAAPLPPQRPQIQRHRAAIARTTVSKPVRLALEAGLFPPATRFFDYGCGQGADLDHVANLGYVSEGWDPYYRPHSKPTAADVVNLGYVINVIEDPLERREALVAAWQLTQRVLIVAAQVWVDDRVRGLMAYGDGIITSRQTFQKYYEQEELKAYIDQVLAVDAIPVALGIYVVFRDAAEGESFRASRFRSRATAPRVRLTVKRFEDYRPLLDPLMAFYTERGRLPGADEIEAAGCAAALAEFGSLRRAFQVVEQATDATEWGAIAEKRRQDWLVYLALSHFGHRPKFRALTPTAQQDIKALFGSYPAACTAADLMLMSLGKPEVIAEHCRTSAIGQQRPNSLWIHLSALEALDPLLRLYEGCASRTIGRPEEATLIKFHISVPKITYLAFPDFATDPHPPLCNSMQIDLRDLHVKYRDYDPTDNPPLLHQKEQTLLPDYPDYAKFAKLSQQEQAWGLLDDLPGIFDRQSWERRLAALGAELRGHRLVWRKDATPAQKSAVRSRPRCPQPPSS